MSMELKEGMRAIFKETKGGWFCDDCVVIEISPSGKNVKLQHSNGKTGWWAVKDLEIIEILNPPQCGA